MSGDWNIEKMTAGGDHVDKLRRGKALTLVDVYDMAADIGKVRFLFKIISSYLF